MKTFQNYIAGTWVDASSGQVFENVNPATGDVLGTFPSATREDTKRAIDAAKMAQVAWGNQPGPNRGLILDKVSQLIHARVDELAACLTREEGKTLAEAKGEVIRARDIFRYFGGEGFRAGGNVLPGNFQDELLFTKREPLGVVGIITPWNFPIAIPAWKIAPALAYGNAVIFKPASLVPETAQRLVEILVEAGVPGGVINFITGSGSIVGEEMATHPGINGISFTGSVTVGTGIYAKAIKNLTRVQLEMGGKNPLVVLKDAKLDLAVSLSVMGGFGLTGQACTATSRVIVEDAIADDYITALSTAAQKLVVGNGLNSGVQMGPAVSQDQLEADIDYVKIGTAEGATLAVGGSLAKVDGTTGHYVQPTVFTDVQSGMRIAQEEIFGPVISVIRAKDFDDAVAIANDISFGLSAGVVTNDMTRALQFANRIEAGVVKINEPTTGLALQAPFGGFKQSSANTFKEQGPAAIEFYTRTKTIYLKY